jgi:hypothetical protein
LKEKEITMSTKANPSPNDCYTRAELDEPMFVLLGRDPAASFVVFLWARMRLGMFGTSEQNIDAQKCAEELRDWAVKLGKTDKLKLAYDAFRMACFEVARAELEAAQAAEAAKTVSESSAG